MVILNAYTDNAWYVTPWNGHHNVRIFIEVSGYTPGNKLMYYLDGGSIGIIDSDNLSFKLPHSNCCSPGCGYEVGVEERDPSGNALPNPVIVTSPKIILCPPGSLFSTQNPIIIDCNVAAGTNVPVQVQSIPASAGYTINAYLDNDYTIVASAVTNSSGIATVILPNPTNGQKYWFTSFLSGIGESFGNSIVIGGSCVNFRINETNTCGNGGASVSFNPSGGSGNYGYSFNNNDQSGYYPLATLSLSNGEHQIYVRDNNDYGKKVMYSVIIDCPFIYDAYVCGTTDVGEVSYPTNSFIGGEIVKGANGTCYEIIGLSSETSANTSIVSEYGTCEECNSIQVTPTPSSSTVTATSSSSTSATQSSQSSSARLRSGVEDEFTQVTAVQDCTLIDFNQACDITTPYTEKMLSVHAMNDRMSVVFPYYKFKKRIVGKLLAGTYEVFAQYESKNGHRSTFHKYKNRVFVTSKPLDGSLPGKVSGTIPDAYKTNHHNRQMGASGEKTLEGLQFEINNIDTRWDYINFVYAYYETDSDPVEIREFSHSIISGSTMLIDLVENSGEPVSKEKLSQRFQNIITAKATVEKDSRKIDLNLEYLPEITVDLSSANISTTTKLLNADNTVEPTFTAIYNPVSKKDNNDPLTNTSVVNKTITIKRNTNENETLSIVDDFENYKGQQVESSLVGHWRGETYPFAIVLVDNKGNDLFAQPITDFTFPEQFGGNGQQYCLTELESSKWKTKILGAIVNGIKLDPNKIYKKKYNPLTCKYERTNELLISGFKIVRGDRFKTIEHQGVVFNTVEVDNHSTKDNKDTRVYPMPNADNRFGLDYTNPANPYQYGDSHQWTPDRFQSGGFDVAAGNGDKVKPTNCPYWVTYNSPDVYIEGKIKTVSKELDKLHHISMVHKAYNNNQIELFGGKRHYYTKNYKTLNIFNDPLTAKGRPKLGDLTRIEEVLEVDKTYATTYVGFDTENPYKEFNPSLGFYFHYFNNYSTANVNKDTILMKLKDIDAVDIIENSGSWASARLMNYKVPSDAIDRKNIQYYSTGHFQQITQAILDGAEKELNGDGSVKRYVFNNIEVWGGDCYVNLFDYSRLMPTYFKGCGKTGDNVYPDYAVSHIIPIESKYNLALRLGRGFANSGTQSQYVSCETATAEQHFSDGIMNQQPEDWNYNRALLNKEKIKFYQQKPEDQVIISNDIAGVVFSPVKIFGAKEDQYRNNLVLDYYTLNGTNGEISRAVKAHGYIYVIQERGFGVLPVNQRAFIPSSEGEIMVKSGNVISDVQYISNIYGTQHPASAWVNNNYIGFVDARMGKQMFFSQAGLAKMSTNNNLDDYITLATIFNDNNQELQSILNKVQNIVACYDFEHDEVLTSFVGYPDNFCLAYGLELSAYTQYFDYSPTMAFNIGRYLFSSVGNKVLLHNYGKYGRFNDVYYKSIIKFIVNPSPTISKVFDNGRINVNKDGVNRITKVFLKTQNETHNLTLHQAGNLVDDRAEYFENDLVFPMHEQDDLGIKSRLRDQQLHVEIEIENGDQATDGLDKRVVISNFDTRYRVSQPNAYVE